MPRCIFGYHLKQINIFEADNSFHFYDSIRLIFGLTCSFCSFWFALLVLFSSIILITCYTVEWHSQWNETCVIFSPYVYKFNNSYLNFLLCKWIRWHKHKDNTQHHKHIFKFTHSFTGMNVFHMISWMYI